MRHDRPSGWGLALDAMIWAGLVLIAVGVGVATFTDVTVPLLWPLAGTAGTLWFGLRELERRALERRELAARQRAALAEPRPTVAQLLGGRYRRGLRVGDEERDIVADALRVHFTAGRLEQAELEQRLTKALEARTVEDLAPLVRDLPSEVTGL